MRKLEDYAIEVMGLGRKLSVAGVYDYLKKVHGADRYIVMRVCDVLDSMGYPYAPWSPETPKTTPGGRA